MLHNIFLPFILGLIIPGYGLLYKNRITHAIIFQCIIILSILLISWSRLIISPLGVITLGILLLGVHITSGFVSVFAGTKHQYNKKYSRILYLFGFPVIAVTVALGIYNQRIKLLGFSPFFIPSDSMTPAIQPGDFIMVDTWKNHIGGFHVGDIIVFSQPTKNGQTLVKRITKIQLENVEKKLTMQYYVLGDNKKNSFDSRHFGLVNSDIIIGKVAFTLMNHDKKGFHFNRVMELKN